jgi:hypothetical protein
MKRTGEEIIVQSCVVTLSFYPTPLAFLPLSLSLRFNSFSELPRLIPPLPASQRVDPCGYISNHVGAANEWGEKKTSLPGCLPACLTACLAASLIWLLLRLTESTNEIELSGSRPGTAPDSPGRPARLPEAALLFLRRLPACLPDKRQKAAAQAAAESTFESCCVVVARGRKHLSLTQQLADDVGYIRLLE